MPTASSIHLLIMGTIINYREKRYDLTKLEGLARHGVAITLETSKINVINPGIGSNVLVVVATGDRYDLLCGLLDPTAEKHAVRLLSKPVLKKIDADAVYIDSQEADRIARMEQQRQYNERYGNRGQYDRPSYNPYRRDRGY